MRHRWSTAIVLIGCAGVLVATPVSSQQARARAPGAWWVGAHLELAFQGTYMDNAIVRFSDGGTDFLLIDPGSAIGFGAQVGYRFQPKWTAQFAVSTASIGAHYVEDLTPRPDIDVKTTQVEVGLVYDVSSLSVGRKTAPFAIGGGLSLTVHSLQRFTWSGEFVEPSTMSIGVHGLAALDIPLAPKVNFRGQAKLTIIPLSVGDLEEKIGQAESVGGAPVTATIDDGTVTHFALFAGIVFKL